MAASFSPRRGSPIKLRSDDFIFSMIFNVKMAIMFIRRPFMVDNPAMNSRQACDTDPDRRCHQDISVILGTIKKAIIVIKDRPVKIYSFRTKWQASNELPSPFNIEIRGQ
jgi:hypothetical protein